MEGSSYGLWSLVVLNSAIFIFFAFSFTKPKTSTDWRSFGAFSAFIVALFTEMYGIPLTIYFLSGWLQTNYPEIDWLAHDSGHLLEMLFWLESQSPLWPISHVEHGSYWLWFWILARAWPVLYRAQRDGTLAIDGPYARIRHPQYVAFVIIMFGFLMQWPTILTLAMFPVLLIVYWRLSLSEEKTAQSEFPGEYEAYAARTPRFIPGSVKSSGVADGL